MLNNMIVCVRGEQMLPDGTHTADTLHCTGTLEKTARGYRIAYTERTESGTVAAELLLAGSRASLTRTGAVQSRMLFAPRERHGAFYAVSGARLTLEVETLALVVDLTDAGGTLSLRYRLHAQGAPLGENTLTLTLTPADA